MFLRSALLVSFTVLLCQSSLAYKANTQDMTPLAVLFGESVVKDLNLETLSDKGDATHDLYMVRYAERNNQQNAGSSTSIGNKDSIYFCGAYLDTMEQVVVDGYDAHLEIFHTKSKTDQAALGVKYGFRHLGRFLNGQKIVTDEEREASKNPELRAGVVGSAETKVTKASIEKTGFERHLRMAQSCNGSPGKLKSLSSADEARTNQRYLTLIDKLTALSKAAARVPSVPAAPAANANAAKK